LRKGPNRCCETANGSFPIVHSESPSLRYVAQVRQ